MGHDGRPPAEPDRFLGALDELLDVLAAIRQESRVISRRAGLIRRQRDRGVSYADIVPTAERPLIVERLRHHVSALVDVAGRLQRAEARALYAEGLSMERIGSLFGLTRQRVSDLIREPRGRVV